ncbi:MAG: M20/M25/M40 family metallo-hydrolase, partial [Eubacterium sp.]|nr:M20/M25/M40 family metallo-hydrolase [Eubacterium sp.]
MIDNEELIRLTQKLVSIESSNIGTFEKEIGDFVYDWMSSETDTEVVKDEFEKDRFNVVSMLKSESDEPPLLIIAHMDTVPIGEGWEHDPFGEIVGDRFYGRGAYDMKCGLATAMLAYRDIANEVIRDGA